VRIVRVRRIAFIVILVTTVIILIARGIVGIAKAATVVILARGMALTVTFTTDVIVVDLEIVCVFKIGTILISAHGIGRVAFAAINVMVCLFRPTSMLFADVAIGIAFVVSIVNVGMF
jgi:hypothetical protein